MLLQTDRHWILSWARWTHRAASQNVQLNYSPIYAYIFQVVSFLQVSRLKLCTHFPYHASSHPSNVAILCVLCNIL